MSLKVCEGCPCDGKGAVACAKNNANCAYLLEWQLKAEEKK